jgi:hypothetical protein
MNLISHDLPEWIGTVNEETNKRNNELSEKWMNKLMAIEK